MTDLVTYSEELDYLAVLHWNPWENEYYCLVEEGSPTEILLQANGTQTYDWVIIGEL